MDNSILQCINMRADFFEKYYSVPPDVQPDVDSFIRELHGLGEQCENAQDFEARFTANGYQGQFNAILMRCTPKPYQMTDDEKAASKQTAKEIFKEDRSRIIKEAALDVVDHASVMAEEQLIAQNRKSMIDAGVYDDYTRASNAVDNAKDVGGFFKKLFKKK